MGYIIYLSLLFILTCASFAIFFYMLWHYILKKYFFIRYKILPFYDYLEKNFDAKYPTVMADIDINAEWSGISNRDNLYAYVYISENSFVLVNSRNSDFSFEIPFSSVIYQRTAIRAMSKNYYCFQILLKVCHNDIERYLIFDTLEYNHRIDKKYGDRLSGEALYNFIRSNFIDKDTYMQTC